MRDTDLNILAIETSTEACSAALLSADGQVFSEFEVAPRRHTVLLPKMMDAVLKAGNCAKSAIDYCAFGNGPGAFTGVRIAAATAQGIAIALKIPLVPISTLAILAQTSFDKHSGNTTLVALDARMSEVYWARYQRDENGLAVLVGEEKLNKLAEVQPESISELGAGHGWLVGESNWQAWFDSKQTHLNVDLLPDARSLIKLAQQAIKLDRVCSAENISINYLRNRVAEQSKPA